MGRALPSPPAVFSSAESPTGARSLRADDARRSDVSPLSSASSPAGDHPPASSTARFTDACLAHLLSPVIVADGLVSQAEFAEFLARRCAWEGRCGDGAAALAFAQLPVGAQLDFVMGACAEASRRAQCVDDLEAAGRGGGEFGFAAAVAGLEGQLRDLCQRSYDHVLKMGSTEAPAPAGRHAPSPPAVGTSNSPPADAGSTGPGLKALPSGPPPRTSKPPGDPLSDGTLARGLVVGMFAMACLSFAALCILHHSRKAPGTVDKLSSHGAHRSAAIHEYSGSLLPVSVFGAHHSLGSSSGSFRDHRFAHVYGPEGTPIPQFDPDSAETVVIGAVSIRAIDNDHGSDMASCLTGSRSTKPRSEGSRSPGSCSMEPHSTGPRSFAGFRSIFLSGRPKGSPAPSGDAPLRDGTSSPSSHRMAPQGDLRDETVWRATGEAGARPGTFRLQASPVAVLASRRRRRAFEQRAGTNGRASFGYWRASSCMTEASLAREGRTRAVVVGRQSEFFADKLLYPGSPPSLPVVTPSEAMSEGLTPFAQCRLRVGSLNEKTPSILSESSLHEASSLSHQQLVTPSAGSISKDSCESDMVASQTHFLVPWQKEGFSSSGKLSEPVEYSNAARKTRRLRSLYGGKALCAKIRKKTKAKTRHRQYQRLTFKGHVVSQDDASMSMKSVSSTYLPPQHAAGTGTSSLPDFVLGTFAAAAMPTYTRDVAAEQARPRVVSPTKQQKSHGMSSKNEEEKTDRTAPAIPACDSRSVSTGVTNSDGVRLQATAIKQSTKIATVPKVCSHISSLDVVQNESTRSFSWHDLGRSASPETSELFDSGWNWNFSDRSLTSSTTTVQVRNHLSGSNYC